MPASRPLRRLATVAVALLLVPLTGLPAATGQPLDPPGPSGPASPPPPPAATVTLVTGDRVRMTPTPEGEPTVEFVPRGGDRTRGYSVRRDAGRVEVIPHDVARLVPDVLDPALFDVTALVEMGYDDAHRDDVPLIVRAAPGPRTLSTSELTIEAAIPSLSASAATLGKADAATFGAGLTALARSASAARGVRGAGRIWLDGRVEATALDGYLTQVGAPAAWDAGLDGSGVTVAVLDTGVDQGHPALAGQVDAAVNFTDEASADDGHGHGTHVASLVAGNGAGSDGARRGVAAGADLLAGKVLNDEGFGQASWIIAGMEWAAAQGADVVNLSLGARAGQDDDPLAKAVDALTARHGTLFVVAAGNDGWLGRNPGSIGSPGIAASALTVAAVRSDDRQAGFSSEGPTRGTHRLKPDVAAPGVDILGARAGARTGDLYLPASGTSQATPIVAGGAALVLQQHPGWTWEQVKSRIVTSSATDPTYSAWTVGGGRLDLAAATSRTVGSDLAGLDFGFLRHPDDAPRSKTVTITNTATAPVTLDVTDHESVEDMTGSPVGPAPDDAVVASPATLTVPAGGTATTTVTLDPGTVDDGRGEGSVVFSADGADVLRLPLGFVDEPPRYDVNLTVVDRHGAPAAASVNLQSGDENVYVNVPLDERGEGRTRLPQGTYSAFAKVVTPAGAGDPETLTIAGDSVVDVHADTTVTLDARDAERLDAPTIKGQRTTVSDTVGIFWSHLVPASGGGSGDVIGVEPADIAAGRIFITPTEAVTHGVFESALRWRLVPAGRTGPQTPAAYELFNTAGRFTDPLSPALDPRDLARVEHTYRGASRPGTRVAGVGFGLPVSGVAAINFREVDVPSETTMLMTASSAVEWSHTLTLPDQVTAGMRAPYRSYAPGERVREMWGDGLHPGLYSAWHSPELLYLEIGVSDGEHVGFSPGGSLESGRLSLYLDDELIDTADGQVDHFDLADRGGRFRLEQQWQLRHDLLPVAGTARTTWEFESRPPRESGQGQTVPTLLDLDYDLPVDSLGRLRAHRPAALDLTVSRKTGFDLESARLRTTDVWASADGTNWVPLRTRRHGAAVRAVVPARLLQSGGQLSLRAKAVADDGTSIDQTVIGMYPVR